MTGIGKTNKGRVRMQNEDSIFVSNTGIGNLPNIFIVADGMGGHKAGDIASNFSIKYFCEYIHNNHFEDEILDLLIGGVKYSNENVYKMSLQDDNYTNMGTTFLAAVVKDGKIYIAHVGDSRLYIIRGGEIFQVTTDHTYVMEMIKAGEITYLEAKNHPNRNVITRALGVGNEILVDGIFSNVLEDDIVLICSDGLSSMITDNEILQIVSQKNLLLENKLDKLIEAANNNGGCDNISVILIS